MSARDRIRRHLGRASRRDLLTIVLPALLLVAAAFWLTARFIQPAPPPRLSIATGAVGGAYQRYAATYKPLLARDGITLDEHPSAGSVENLELLRAGRVEAGFVQGGTAAAEEDDTLLSLGALYYEPLWIFYRAELAGSRRSLDKLAQLRGRRIAIDLPGSGSRQLATELLHANGMDDDATVLRQIGGLEAAAALAAGRLDAVMVVGPTQSAIVWTLLYTPGVRLMSLANAEAYVRMFPQLSRVTLPRGAIDLVRDIPRHDVALLAPMATLVMRSDAHPAHVDLLLQTIQEAHGGPGVFHHPGEFPRAIGVDFPLAPQAERFYKSGKPFLQRYLPFWAANLIDRMVVMLIPLFAVLVPVFRLAPGLYSWRVRSRIYRRYGELKFLEAELEREPEPKRREEWLGRLEAIERDVNRIPTPLAYADMLYTLRGHIGLVREAVMRKCGASTTTGET